MEYIQDVCHKSFCENVNLKCCVKMFLNLHCYNVKHFIELGFKNIDFFPYKVYMKNIFLRNT